MSGRLPRATLRIALLLGSLSLASCSAISSGIGSITGTTQKKDAEEKATQVQAEVMGFADLYVGQMMNATANIPTPTAEDQVRLLGFQVRQASAAYEIASGTNPLAALVDLAVLVTLTHRIVERYWVPEVFHESGQPLLDVLAKFEKAVWKGTDKVMEPEKEEKLRKFLDRWIARYPDLHDASSIRMASLMGAGTQDVDGLGTANDIFRSLGLDPFAGIDPAVAQVQQSRILAERAFYFLKRWPRLLELQSRLLALQLALQPTPARLADDLHRVSLAAESVSRVADGLPELVDKEREAAIRQVLDAMQEQEGRARALLSEMRRTLDAGKGAATAVDGAFRSLDAILAASKAPSGSGGAPSHPFDVNEYTRALEQLGRSATELEALLRAVNQDAPRVATLIGDAGREVTARGQALVDLAFQRALVVVLVLVLSTLVAALVYRWAAIRMNRS
jgi:hypothetical protein